MSGTRLVGLTGGIASGKSTVARMLTELGASVVDADQAARAVVEPGQPALAAIVDAFGPEVLGPDGRLDRPAMRARIVADPKARAILEAITHPAIRTWVAERVAEQVAAGAPVAVVEAALLVETGGYRMYPTLVVVSCDPELQIRRVMARDEVDEAGARAIVASQLPLSEKEKVATHVIRNEGDLGSLRARVAELWEELAGPMP